jgi:hypothetical protein
MKMTDFAAGRQMAIKSTYFMHKRIHLQNWHSPDEHTFNQIDHCLIDGLTEDTFLTSQMLWRGGMQTSIQTTCWSCRASNTKLQQL